MPHSQTTTKKKSDEIKAKGQANKAKTNKGIKIGGLYFGVSKNVKKGYTGPKVAGIRIGRKVDKITNSPIKALSVNYDFTNSVVAEILDVSTKTLNRYQENAKALSAQQRDRIKVVESVLAIGKRVLGSEEEVKHWLYRPVHSIENQRPIDLIVSESGRRRVENVLLQIEGGAY